MRNLARRLALTVTGSIALGACGNSTASTTGQLGVQLTDAPFPFGQVSRADIFVVRIDAKVAAVDSLEASDETRMSGWTTIATPNKSINLLTLTGGTTSNLGASALATGTYQGFRMIIDASQSSITLTDGTKPTIKWPSAAHTGIKINLDHSIAVTKDSSVMVLDFAERPAVQAGHSRRRDGADGQRIGLGARWDGDRRGHGRRHSRGAQGWLRDHGHRECGRRPVNAD